MSPQGDHNCNQEVPRTPDSGIDMANGQDLGAMANAANNPQNALVSIERYGVTVSYTLGQITEMGAALARARAEGLFPPTTAASHDVQAITSDYFRLVQLTAARGNAPREEWNQMRHVVQLLVEITQEIRVRDKVAAEKTEEERVQAHVTNMMSGVSAENKLYDIVKHAVVHAVQNGTAAEATAGQNMANLLNGIRGVIKEMAGQGTHNVDGVNIEAVLEDVFGMIDFALGNVVDPLGRNVQQMQGQLNHVDGQISQLDSITNGQVDAIGHHVNAISGHVRSLGNNINAFGTLLNSTNGNVVSLNTQIALLQTIINMLPRMISEALQQMLPEAMQSSIGPVMQALEAQLGTALPIGAARGTQQQPRGLKKLFKSVKKMFRKH
ncbi:hypothetical protein F5Y00DRAFT_268618 [Daldinia vernicosa]|uniref:uncharacterized protein n=1 Tax=Daldinia vernicosa TaxID=114800 RepID=UPI00200878C3|nr:uncharacterized protein F5Y00DRAFT_268618 [Daldinia vernicosa]KAI0850126.1 hypothetical protein F5Y00DRAFT_268618 [Daldinia vernicosa]